MNTKQRIEWIEEEIRNMPYHKGTERHIGILRARMAKLKEELYQSTGKKSGGGKGYAVAKSGEASVVLIGPPSVGKSTLINQLTRTQSKVAAYDFTTLNVIPGMMNYKGAQIQIFDVPGIISGAASGKGRGKEVLSVVRGADLVVIMIDVKTIEKIDLIKEELYQFGIRLDQEPPQVKIKKADKGGIEVISNYSSPGLSKETIKAMAQEFRVRNGEITIKEKITTERLIDAFIGNRIYLPYLVVVNKADLVKEVRGINADYLLISAEKKVNLEQLKEQIWQKLGLIRIYFRRTRGKTDFEEPMIVRKGQTLFQILGNISICDKDTFTKAKVNGPGARFPNQEVSLSFVPQEGTIINFSS